MVSARAWADPPWIGASSGTALRSKGAEHKEGIPAAHFARHAPPKLWGGSLAVHCQRAKATAVHGRDIAWDLCSRKSRPRSREPDSADGVSSVWD